MTDAEFRKRVRELVKLVDDGDIPEARAAAAQIRELLAERGLEPRCHEGRKDLDGTIAGVEWYAGQLPAIVDREAWFAINSWCNCVDKFVPQSEAP